MLTYFRDRLLNHEQGRLVLDTILDGLYDAGLVAKRARQRLDSTHVLGVVRQMSSLECVRETLRLTLETLAGAVAEAARPAAWKNWWERYVESKLDYRAEEQTLWEKLDQAGADAWALLEWVLELPVTVQTQPKVTLLAQVFDEYFERVEQQWKGRRQHVTGGIRNPHEPETQWRTKGKKKSWLGYQVQVAETAAEEPVQPGEPTRQFVTAVETQLATASDEAGLEEVLAVQETAGRERPSELYVDGAYVSAAKIVEARAEGWELLGPAQPSASKGTGYRAVCGGHRGADGDLSGRRSEHAMQSAGRSGERESELPVRVKLAMSGLRAPGSVRGRQAKSSQFGGGRTSRRVASAAAGDEEHGVYRIDETAGGD